MCQRREEGYRKGGAHPPASGSEDSQLLEKVNNPKKEDRKQTPATATNAEGAENAAA